MSSTDTVFYYSPQPLDFHSWEAVKIAKAYVYGDDPVEFVPVPAPSDGVLCFDLRAAHGIRTLGNWEMRTYPNAAAYVAVALKRYKDDELPPLPETWLAIDIESHSITERWNMPREEYFRLGQWLDYNIGACTTESFGEFASMLAFSTLCHPEGVLIAHNGHGFDFTILFGDRALQLALNHQLFDTMIHAITNFPAPPQYMTPKGFRMKSDTPKGARGFYSLEKLCFTFGIEGKHGDLNDLAKRLGCGIGEIPLDNEEFLEYSRQDVIALDMLARAMLYVAPMTEVSWREQKIAACNAQISRNGWRVDIPAAERRRDELSLRKDQLLGRLVRDYNFPTTGIKPWASKVGKEAILRLLEAHGISRHELPTTDSGAPSLGGEGILEVTAGTQVEDMGRSLAELMGQRSLPQLALDCTHKDGRVHPSILPLQRSGRWSVTEPGLTIWGSKEGKDDDKAYFLPDSDDEVLIEADYSAADARIVAALSGDKEYAKRFEVNEDGTAKYDPHNLTGEAAFGKEAYYETLLKNGKPLLRDMAKMISHLTNYRGGPPKLSASMNDTAAKLGLDLRYSVAEATVFINNIDKTYKDVTAWKSRAEAEGQTGWIVNDWGRSMAVIEGKAYTQAPALLGQGGTRDILGDGLLRMAEHGLMTYVKCHIHDAVVFSIPKAELEEILPQLVACMETVYRGMSFPVSTGHGAPNWKEAAHG